LDSDLSLVLADLQEETEDVLLKNLAVLTAHSEMKVLQFSIALSLL